MYKGFLLSSIAAFAIALAGAVSAESAAQTKTEEMLKGEAKELSGDMGGGMPSSVKTPASNAEAQAKTEKMLKGEAKELSGDQGGGMPSEVKEATPDAKEQAKTEHMLEKEKEALQGR